MKLKIILTIIITIHLNRITAAHHAWQKAGKEALKTGFKFISNQSKNIVSTYTSQIKEKPFEASTGAVIGGITAYTFSGTNDEITTKTGKVMTGITLGIVMGLRKGSINSKLDTIFNELKALRTEQKNSFLQLNTLIQDKFKTTNDKVDFLLSRTKRIGSIFLGRLRQVKAHHIELHTKIDNLQQEIRSNHASINQ